MGRCIGKKQSNNSIIECGIEQRSDNNSNSEEQKSEFSSLLLEGIREKTAVAAADAAIYSEFLASVWIILAKRNKIEFTGGIMVRMWNKGMLSVGEGTWLLDLKK